MYAFALVWTAVASSAITTIVLKRRGHASRTGELYPVPSWVPPADELRRHMTVPMPAAAAAVTIRFVVPEDAPESWERDETRPHRMASASSRLPTVPA